jgi:glucan-binding YG repeat protein
VWYFFDENAYCKTNTWVFWNGKWYYLDVNGAMLVNTTTPDGKQVGEDGALL